MLIDLYGVLGIDLHATMLVCNSLCHIVRVQAYLIYTTTSWKVLLSNVADYGPHNLSGKKLHRLTLTTNFFTDNLLIDFFSSFILLLLFKSKSYFFIVKLEKKLSYDSILSTVKNCPLYLEVEIYDWGSKQVHQNNYFH